MRYAIIRGANGRRHEVDFGDAPVRVEIYASEETVEIFIEADFETLAEERRRFAIFNIPTTCLAKPPPQRREGPTILVPHPNCSCTKCRGGSSTLTIRGVLVRRRINSIRPLAPPKLFVPPPITS
jgi:hypothetical protein